MQPQGFFLIPKFLGVLLCGEGRRCTDGTATDGDAGITAL